MNDLDLQLLEMPQPVGPDYQDVRSLYASSRLINDKTKVEEIKAILARLPKINLITLDAIVSHLRSSVSQSYAELAWVSPY